MNDMKDIHAHPDKQNRVFKRCGFKPVGVLQFKREHGS